MLELKNLSLVIGSRTLFADASLTIFSGDKVGIVGHNGCGKTTLLRAITGQMMPESGEIAIKRGVKIVSVQQEIADKSVGVLDYVLSADKTLFELRERLNDPSADLADIYDRLAAIDGNTADARASAILAGLGFKNGTLRSPLSTFSGGWQVRAALAAALFTPSDILILDEPTNHLDLESVIWLESFLRSSEKALLLVSHEKAFLDGVCNKILNITGEHAKLYTGNYSTFLRTREEQQQALLKNFESQQKKREHIQEFVDRFRYKATKARQVQSRLKLLDKLEIIEPQVDNYEVCFKFSTPFPEVDRRLVTLEHISAGYGKHTVLRDVSLNIDYGERTALLGANGNGKSTLAKVIASRLPPFSGKVIIARNLKIGYFSQQQTDELDLSCTALEMFKRHNPEQSDEQVRTTLASFGLIQARALTKIERLSGGEKTRLLLAIVASRRPHLLILDEPTNHLDIEAREALIDSLKKYPGAVIWISHDFHTIESSCEKFYIVHDGGCERFNGTLEDYKSQLLAGCEAFAKGSTKNNKKNPTKKSSNLPDKKTLRRIDSLEKEIQELSDKRSVLEHELNSDYSVAIYEEYNNLSAHLKELEDEWMTLMEGREI